MTREEILQAVKDGKSLRHADLSHADLSGADLSCADLRGADLVYADLSYAGLRGADLGYANLRGADLVYADLSYAGLRGADLGYANLSGANLGHANLSDAGLHRWAQVAFDAHGERGRMLTAYIQKEGDVATYQCGCFHGDAEKLMAYIREGGAGLLESRTAAVRAVEVLLTFKQPER